MKEAARKIIALPLAIFLVAPSLAWSAGASEGGAEFLGADTPGMEAGAEIAAPQDISGIDLNAASPIEDAAGAKNLGAEHPAASVQETAGQALLGAAQVREIAPAERISPQAAHNSATRATEVNSIPAPNVVRLVTRPKDIDALVSASAPAVRQAPARPSYLDMMRGIARLSKLQVDQAASNDSAQGKLSHTYAALEDAYDGDLSASAGGAEVSEGDASGEGDEGISEESRKLHTEFMEAEKIKMQSFQKKIANFKAGIFSAGIAMRQGANGISYDMIAVVNGKPMPNDVIEKKLASGEILQSERVNWEIAKAAIQGFRQGLKALVASNEQGHQAVHQQMERIERASAQRRLNERQAIGKDLESWGVPNTISVDLGEQGGLRYSRLYRLNGLPTDLGAALHKVLAPMVAEDPAILARITYNQIHDAVRSLADGLQYSLDPSSEDFQKLRRMGLMSEGYSYPEWVEAFQKEAREELLSTPEPGDQSFGLGMRPGKKTPTEMLEEIADDVASQYKAKISQGTSDEEIAKLEELILALSATMGNPVNMGQGPVPVVVRHRQLLPVLRELYKRQAEESVIKAVMRAFPLGESLYRLGIHKEWAKGWTGKGVKIAVMDNNVAPHPDFDGDEIMSENFTRDRGWFTKGPHATPMADIIHAIAPDAEIQSYQWFSNSRLAGVALSEQETTAAFLKAMDRAKANGAQIINVSAGSVSGLSNDSFARKVAELAKEGILVVVSAGNEGFDLPAGFQLRTPGTAPDSITVGAVDYHGKKAYFSSTGRAMNPDNYTMEKKPDIYTFGVNIKAATRLPKEVYQQEPVPYNDVSGTSPAAPHIAGVLGLGVQAAQSQGIQMRAVGIGATVAAKQALRAAARVVNRLSVLDSAGKVVQGFVRILSPRP